MSPKQENSRLIPVTLWVAQSISASSLVWSGWIKMFQAAGEVAAMWPWAGEVPAALLKFTGAADLLAAAGLILPVLFSIRPRLTPIAAVAVIIMMICAAVFHITRGEASQIGINIVFAFIAAFIAWGRFRETPLGLKSEK
jgi:uncharacterized membrane protein YphA (DoxX/SURF4 family)